MDTDLIIDNGDLQVENGQLKLISEDVNIQYAILRRIQTPINTYTKSYISSTGEFISLDNDYGNISYELTSLDSQLIIEQVRDNLTLITSKEPRINLQDINIYNDIINGVTVNITYFIDDILQTLTI